MLGRVLREPLTHFIGLALAIFLLYGVVSRSAEPKADEIIVTSAKIEQLGSLFTKTWQRPPSAQELKGLIDDYVKEEIYNREALLLGLDRDDTVIRRRLRQKMEFLVDAEVDAMAPTDAQLEVYLKANADQFRIEPMMAFEQIYLSPAKRGDRIDADARGMLDQVRGNPQVDPARLGDQTLLPSMLSLATKAQDQSDIRRHVCRRAGEVTGESVVGARSFQLRSPSRSRHRAQGGSQPGTLRGA
jgi:hypothetical protein